MTREEAIETLNEIPTIGEQVDALEMAIEALEQEPKIVPIAEIKFDDDMLHEIVKEAVKNIKIEPRWTPVSERLPEDRQSVLVWCPQYKNIYCAYIRKEHWWIFGAVCQSVPNEVVAWMPLPNKPQESEG